MAEKKRTPSRKRRSSDLVRFPEVKGKIIERVELDPEAVVIVFQDKTVLSFDLNPVVLVFPELSDWKTGDWKKIKHWPPVQSKGSMVQWALKADELEQDTRQKWRVFLS